MQFFRMLGPAFFCLWLLGVLLIFVINLYAPQFGWIPVVYFMVVFLARFMTKDKKDE